MAALSDLQTMLSQKRKHLDNLFLQYYSLRRRHVAILRVKRMHLVWIGMYKDANPTKQSSGNSEFDRLYAESFIGADTPIDWKIPNYWTRIDQCNSQLERIEKMLDGLATQCHLFESIQFMADYPAAKAEIDHFFLSSHASVIRPRRQGHQRKYEETIPKYFLHQGKQLDRLAREVMLRMIVLEMDLLGTEYTINEWKHLHRLREQAIVEFLQPSVIPQHRMPEFSLSQALQPGEGNSRETSPLFLFHRSVDRGFRAFATNLTAQAETLRALIGQLHVMYNTRAMEQQTLHKLTRKMHDLHVILSYLKHAPILEDGDVVLSAELRRILILNIPETHELPSEGDHMLVNKIFLQQLLTDSLQFTANMAKTVTTPFSKALQDRANDAVENYLRTADKFYTDFRFNIMHYLSHPGQTSEAVITFRYIEAYYNQAFYGLVFNDIFVAEDEGIELTFPSMNIEGEIQRYSINRFMSIRADQKTYRVDYLRFSSPAMDQIGFYHRNEFHPLITIQPGNDKCHYNRTTHNFALTADVKNSKKVLYDLAQGFV